MMKLAESDKCTGCFACYSACDFQNIVMSSDSLGFYYPVVDEDKCVRCNKCVKSCPTVNGEGLFYRKSGRESYVAVHKDEVVLMNSSSGGAFTAIVDAFCQGESCLICAAMYDDNMKVIHKVAGKDDESFCKFRGSKYVQSYIGDAYKIIKNLLREGKKVLFIGTPCQVAGLKKFLNKKYETLLLIDILCTGAGSPRFFSSLISFLEYKRKKKVVDYKMRKKVIQKSGEYRVMEHEIVYEDSAERNAFFSNLYKKIYYNHIYLRSCCYECDYKSENRVGDITIGDWWGDVERLDTTYRGASVIIFNTSEHKEILLNLKRTMNLQKVDYSRIVQQQPALREKNMQGRKKYKNTGRLSNKGDGFFVAFMIWYSLLLSFTQIIKSIIKQIMPGKVIDKVRQIRRK